MHAQSRTHVGFSGNAMTFCYAFSLMNERALQPHMRMVHFSFIDMKIYIYLYSQTKQKHIYQHINNNQQQLRPQPIFCTSFILTLLHSVYVCNFRLFASCPISLPATLNTWSTFLILGLAYFYCDLTFDFIYIHISLFSGVIVFLLFIYRLKMNVVLRKNIKFISKVCISIWHKCFSQSRKAFFYFILKFRILSVNGVLHAFISM